jgi:putative transposase
MPNHFHGIMIIDNTRETVVPVNVVGVVSVVETGLKPVSTTDTDMDMDMDMDMDSQSLTTNHGIFEFVRALKTFSSRRMNELDNTTGKSRWQSRFYDHIIRDEQEFHRIKQYIFNNPSEWENDTLKS